MKDYEKNIVLFVYRFKILLSTNIKYLLGNKKYYQIVVKRLVDKGYLRRYKTKYLMLGQVGKKYIKELGYISKKSSKRFCNSIIYDFQKEQKYKQAILFIEDINMINIKDYAFGSNQFIIFSCSFENWIYLFSEQFKIDYRKILDELGYHNSFISKWYFCDYETQNKQFITFLPFIDCEKIYKLMIFCRENKKYIENLHIVCSKNVANILNKYFPILKISIIDFEKYIKDFNVYYIG